MLSLENQLAVGQARYGTLRNESSFMAQCGHCGEETEHDGKTERCKACGAKGQR